MLFAAGKISSTQRRYCSLEGWSPSDATSCGSAIPLREMAVMLT